MVKSLVRNLEESYNLKVVTSNAKVEPRKECLVRCPAVITFTEDETINRNQIEMDSTKIEVKLKTPVISLQEVEIVLSKLLYKRGFILGLRSSESRKTLDSI